MSFQEAQDSCSVGAALTDCDSGYCSNGHCSREGFAYIPAGRFSMGSPDGSRECMGEIWPLEPGRDTDEILHEVTLTRAFLIQETEVSQEQWMQRFSDHNPSHFAECGVKCPVESVNWWEAMAYANATSVSEGLWSCYTLST